MNDLLGELETVLASELDELQRMVPILEDEERAIRAADVSTVLVITERKASFGRRIGALEARRRTLAAAIADQLDVSPENVTLSSLETLVPSSRSRIAPLRQAFREVLDQLLASTSRNAFLMEQSLGSLQRLLADLIAVLAPGATYDADGRTGQLGSALQLLDRRA
jgi:flagellar biosynthesis/type III secretory pathway chaperone